MMIKTKKFHTISASLIAAPCVSCRMSLSPLAFPHFKMCIFKNNIIIILMWSCASSASSYHWRSHCHRCCRMKSEMICNWTTLNDCITIQSCCCCNSFFFYANVSIKIYYFNCDFISISVEKEGNFSKSSQDCVNTI